MSITDGSGRDVPIFYGAVEQVVRGALALATEFFPRTTDAGGVAVRTDDALFFLSGQMDKWSRWPALALEHKRRVAQLLRFRPVELANRTGFLELLDALLPTRLPEYQTVGDGAVLFVGGRAPIEIVDECIQHLWREREMRERRPPTIANSGEYLTQIFGGRAVPRAVEARYTLEMTPPVEPESPIDLGPAASADEVPIPVGDLAALASRLDSAFGQEHRTASVKRIFTYVQADPQNRIDGRWTVRAGRTQLFNAPTGVGKNVLAELVACWNAQRGMITSILVPKNSVVVQISHAIEASFAALGIDGSVVPLMSPSSSEAVAETMAAALPTGDPLGQWAFERLAYGCALQAAASTDDVVDTWRPGQEPCRSLLKAGPNGGTVSSKYTCPYKPTCGKFRLARSACEATVVVTSHMNFLVGRVQVPTSIGTRIEESMTIEELLLHRSHVLIIDEIDAFQASMISNSAKGLELANRRGGSNTSPLRRLDNELADALGRLNHIESGVRGATLQARYLAENYTLHLVEGRFQRSGDGRHRAAPQANRWLLPRKWDGWLAATMFGVDDDEHLSQHHFDALQALLPDAEHHPLPDWLLPIAATLDVLSKPSADDGIFDDAWGEIYSHLGDAPYEGTRLADDEIRASVTDRLIRRAFLERLRVLLFNFVYKAPQLHASGIRAAGEIADALGQYASWRAAPYGPMGRVLFAFTESHDEDNPRATALRVNGFGGDPHTYVATLGELTSLAHTGLPRVVLGLSATGFFPGAPHHHVFAVPSWWVPDDHEDTGGIVLKASPVSDEEREFVRVSGTYGPERQAALRSLGRMLWTKRLLPALDELAQNGATAHRSRLLLATTSYEGARDLAIGISSAGVPKEKIVVAVRAADEATFSNETWTSLSADRLEEFGTTVDGAVLIAPLARAERGLNIVDNEGRSLIGSVWLIVRPIPILDEPAELLAHVHSRAHAEATPTVDPAAVLHLMRQAAAKHYDELFLTVPYFRALPLNTQLAIATETLNGLIQLAGRARRGGDIGEIHLVDYAFHDAAGRSDLPGLIGQIRDNWTPSELHLMRSLYGGTLEVILDFADKRQIEP